MLSIIQIILQFYLLQHIYYVLNDIFQINFVILIQMFTKIAKNIFTFSSFYHPCKFNLTPEHALLSTCNLGNYVRQYRAYGHYYAKIDPLNLYNKEYTQFIRPTDVKLTFQDNIKNFNFKSPVTSSSASIQQLQTKLKEVYLGSVGVEFEHIIQLEEKQWLYSTYEQIKLTQLTKQNKLKLATTIVQAQALDHFIHKKWNMYKRYSGEGAQSTVAALDYIFDLSSKAGYQHVVFGMPHRGRLNTLVNILLYSARYLFRKISGKTDTPMELPNIIDDVTSHIAQSVTKNYDNKNIKVTLVHNPSHLQAQNPVSMGKTRSKQHIYGKDKVLNVQVHGDAAVCAQGIVAQTLCLAKTPKFDINGTIHIVTNNQIGYTTRPIDSRPSKYPTDLFKAYDIPVLHINSENIEDVYRGVQLAVKYQSKYKKDIILDIICYRKYGHNEVDEPQFTQPIMYNKIRKHHQPTPLKYSKLLIAEGLVPDNFYDKVRQQKFVYYQAQYQQSKKITTISLNDYTNPNNLHAARAFTEKWQNFKPSQHGQEYSTAYDIELLKQYAQASVFYPNTFALHNRIKKFHIDKRIKAIQENSLDWATCQALAFYSLNNEGYNIRMTGQDVERGTFSQRHLNLIDQKTQENFNPLQFFAKQNSGRGQVQIYNSALTQNACLSYQYGYSIDNPLNLSIWEAQFGDFYNTAQTVVDTYLTNSQNKWLRQSSLTLILPHGYDGTGPEHSSCRIQRFLQMANSDGNLKYFKRREHEPQRKALKINESVFYENIQQANFSLVFPSTPANLFHLLRRQMKRNFRKPLIIAGPKILLRHPKCNSKFEEMGPNTSFQPIIPYYNHQNLKNCTRVFLTSGKFVYNIEELIIEKKSQRTCLIAVQQLFPFPEGKLQNLLEGINKDAEVYWIQEQNLNSGAFQFIQNRVNRILNNLKVSNELRYVGRRSIAATAVGSSQLHKIEQNELNVWIKQLIE